MQTDINKIIDFINSLKGVSSIQVCDETDRKFFVSDEDREKITLFLKEKYPNAEEVSSNSWQIFAKEEEEEMIKIIFNEGLVSVTEYCIGVES